MTVQEILKHVEPHKPMSRATLYTNLRRLKIKPIGALQIPQQYPEDTPERILIRLGFRKHPKNLRSRRAAERRAA